MQILPQQSHKYNDSCVLINSNYFLSVNFVIKYFDNRVVDSYVMGRYSNLLFYIRLSLYLKFYI